MRGEDARAEAQGPRGLLWDSVSFFVCVCVLFSFQTSSVLLTNPVVLFCCMCVFFAGFRVLAGVSWVAQGRPQPEALSKPETRNLKSKMLFSSLLLSLSSCFIVGIPVTALDKKLLYPRQGTLDFLKALSAVLIPVPFKLKL